MLLTIGPAVAELAELEEGDLLALLDRVRQGGPVGLWEEQGQAATHHRYQGEHPGGQLGGELGQGSQGGGEDLELSGALYIISVTWNDPSSSRMLDTFYIDSLSCYTHYTVFQYLRICFNNGIALTYNYYILLKISQRNSSTHPTNSGNQGTGSNPSIPEVGWHQL